jgi:hypothetical protein
LQLLRIQKERVGGQDERATPFGLLDKNCAFIGDLFDRKKVTHRVVSISFDSVITEKGLQWDVSGKMTGVDPDLQFDVVTKTFMQRVSCYLTLSLSFIQLSSSLPCFFL